MCEGDADIDIAFTLSTTDLGDDEAVADSVAPILRQLLWAWGNTADDACPYVLAAAEIAHFGADSCPNDGQSKPRNRATCSACLAAGNTATRTPG